MALSAPTSLYLEELARKRANAANLTQSGAAAQNMLMGGLTGLQKTQEKDREALRLETNAANTQANAERDAIRLEASAKAAADNAAGNLDINQKTALRLSEAQDFEQGRQLDTDLKSAIVNKVQSAVNGASDEDFSDEEIATIAETTGATPDQVRAAVNERRIATKARSLPGQKLSEDIRHNKAGEANDRARIAAMENPKPMSPLDQARIDALNNRQVTAASKDLEDFQQAEKKLARMERVITGAEKYNTGWMADRAAEVAADVLPDAAAKKFGLSDRALWKTDVVEGFNEIVKEQAGSAVSASEMTRQLAAQLHTKLDDTAFDLLANKIAKSYADDIARAKARLTPASRAAAVAPPTKGAALPSLEEMTPDDLDALSPEQQEALLRAAGG